MTDQGLNETRGRAGVRRASGGATGSASGSVAPPEGGFFRGAAIMAAGGVIGWSLFAAIALFDRDATSVNVVAERLEELVVANEAMRDRLTQSEARVRALSERLRDKHEALSGARDAQAADEGELAEARENLRELARERDLAVVAREQMSARLGELEEALDIAREATGIDKYSSGDPTADAAALADRMKALEARVTRLKESHRTLVDRLEETAGLKLVELEAIVRSTGLDPDALIAGSDGSGGPFFSVQDMKRLAASAELPELEGKLRRLNSNLGRLERLQAVIDRLPFGLPVKSAYRATSGYGPRRDPLGRGRAFHSGFDMAAGSGTTIGAAAPGRVVYAGWKGAYGRLVEIQHGGGLRTRYAHLARVSVKVGDQVKRGQKIGAMGSSGRSTGVHLHYEVWVKDRVIDPAPFLRAGRRLGL